MSRCAGAGREHSQPASPRWPMEIFHTIDVMISLLMGVGWAAGMLFSILSFPGVQTFLEVWSFSVSLVNYAKFANLAKSMMFVSSVKPMGSKITVWGVSTQLVIGQREKDCFVYSLLCIFSSSSRVVVLVLVFPLLPS